MRSAERLAGLLSWGVLAALLTAQLFWIAKYGVDVPLSDEWSLIPMAEGNQLGPAGLWEAHRGVHRLPLPRLVYFALLSLCDWDFRAPMVFNALALAALGAVWLWAARKMRGAHSLSDVFIPLLLLRGSMMFHVLFGFQMTFILGTLMSGMLLALLLALPRLDLRSWFAPVALAVLLLPLTGANGLIAALPLVGWMVAVAALGWVRGPWMVSRSTAAAYLTSAALAGGLAVAYVWDLEGLRDASPTGESRVLGATIEFWGHSLGPLGVLASPTAGVVVVLLIALVLAYAVRSLRRKPEAIATTLGVVALAFSWILVGVGVGFGRSGGLAERYSILAAPIAAWIYLVPLRVAPNARWGVALRWALAACLLASFPWDLRQGLRWAEMQREVRASFARDVQATGGLPVRLLPKLTREHSGSKGLVSPQAGYLGRRLEIMQRLGFGPYRGLPAVGPQRVVLFVADSASAGLGEAPQPLSRLLDKGVRFEGAHLATGTRRWLKSLALPLESESVELECDLCRVVGGPAKRTEYPPFSVIRVPVALEGPCDHARLTELCESSDALILWLALGKHPSGAVLVAAWPAQALTSDVDNERLGVERFLRDLGVR